MAKDSGIEWTNHTLNLVWGCTKVSDGCKNCYAETLARRYGFAVWGPAKTTERRTMRAGYWKQPLRWNARAEQAGQRARVFCSSMADVFEDHPTNNQERLKLFDLIAQTPWLDWQLLTKRPENIGMMIPVAWHDVFPSNVWLGTSVENQEQAEKRIPELTRWLAPVLFLSCEPLLGLLNLEDLAYEAAGPEWVGYNKLVDWIIAGGESGHGARPAHPDWFRSLRDQCVAAGIPFFFKQWGQFGPPSAYNSGELAFEDGQRMRRYPSKHDAGRLLDGREWNQFPEVLE